MTAILPPTPENLQQAALCLRQGGLVAIPTETVYGLAANAADDQAVGRIFEAKRRPANHPLIVHLADAQHMDSWAANPSAEARTLAQAFWPGPLTLILQRQHQTSLAVTGGLPTIALRVPAHPVAQELLRVFGGGLAAPSANTFGSVSPTTAAHVAASLGDRVGLIIDGGPCAVGLESTIVDVSGVDPLAPEAQVLRPGGVSLEELERVLGHAVPIRASDVVRAPGQLPSHYAPDAKVLLVPERELAGEAATLAAQGLKVAVLTPDVSREWPPGVVPIFLPREPIQAAQRLYQALRDVDQKGCQVALTSLPLEQGLGLAVADRLRKAAGPR